MISRRRRFRAALGRRASRAAAARGFFKNREFEVCVDEQGRMFRKIPAEFFFKFYLKHRPAQTLIRVLTS